MGTIGKNKRVIVIGGGASGLAAGISAARQGAEVTVLEHMDRVGKKLLSTGNGRCNLSNLVMEAGCFHCSQEGFPMKVLRQFGVEETLDFFSGIGIEAKGKNGYLYPRPEQASAVVDMLRLELARLGVKVFTRCEVGQLRRQPKSGFVAVTGQGGFAGDALILSAGSRAAPSTGSDGSGYRLAKGFGHRVIAPLPALVQLRCEGKHFKRLAGVRCEAKVTLVSGGKALAEDTGEVQMTDYGISGIPTFQVSRFASIALAGQKPVKAILDFLPAKTWEETEGFLQMRAKRLAHLTCGDFLTGVLHKKLAGVLLSLSHVNPEETVAQVGPSAFKRLAGQIKSFEAPVTGTNPFEQAQVCCGGVDTREIDPFTMESRLVRGLYLAGEILDVDGMCGGYNLQWAWSTGYIAGSCAGKR